jgi:hypothetical protein
LTTLQKPLLSLEKKVVSTFVNFCGFGFSTLNNHYENDDSSVVVRASQINPPPNAKGPQNHYLYGEYAVSSEFAANNSASRRIRKLQQQPDATSELSTAMTARPSPAFGKRIGILNF